MNISGWGWGTSQGRKPSWGVWVPPNLRARLLPGSCSWENFQASFWSIFAVVISPPVNATPCSWHCSISLSSWSCKPIKVPLIMQITLLIAGIAIALSQWSESLSVCRITSPNYILDVTSHGTRLFLKVTSWNHARSLVLSFLAVCSFWCLQALLFIIINIKQAAWEALGAGLAGLSLHLTCKCSACAHIWPLARSELSSFTHNWGALGGCGVCAQNTRAQEFKPGREQNTK